MGLFKTIYYNFYLFPIRIAILFPLAMTGKTKFRCKRGSIIYNISRPKSASLTFGLSHDGCSLKNDSLIIIDGKIMLENGYHKFASGTILRVRENGVFKLGDNISVGSSCKFYINQHSSIGNDCLISWDCQFMDNDSHPIYDSNGNFINHSRGFNIMNNVWIGSNCTILKGVIIAKGAIIPSCSIISKPILSEDVISTGYRILRRNVVWKNEPLII